MRSQINHLELEQFIKDSIPVDHRKVDTENVSLPCLHECPNMSHICGLMKSLYMDIPSHRIIMTNHHGVEWWHRDGQ